MRWFNQGLILASVLMTPVAMIATVAHSAKGPDTSVGQMLADSELWGDTGLAAIAAIGHWTRVGESTISVYTDKLVSGSKYSTQATALTAVSRFAVVTKRALPRLRSGDTSTTAKRSRSLLTSLKAEPIRLWEDDSYRIGWTGIQGAFLKPNVAIQTVIARYGKPQNTMTEVVHAQGERRPAILTIHEYNDGAVKFVESDHSANPGSIDRVILDTRAVAHELYVSDP